jgi:hypothetical protein
MGFENRLKAEGIFASCETTGILNKAGAVRIFPEKSLGSHRKQRDNMKTKTGGTLIFPFMPIRTFTCYTYI